MPKTKRYYKVLGGNAATQYGGSFRYDLPKWKAGKWVPGKWTQPATPKLCESGYHVTDADHLIEFLNYGPMICVAEVRGAADVGKDKSAHESIRLTEILPWDGVSARLFAVECAADVLPLFEAKYPDDPRVADCLEVAYRYAFGDATDAERSAASSAASSAAYWAASSAAYSAASSAASSAAYWAASSADSSAAYSAAYSAARAKQTARLMFWIGETNAYHED